MTEEERIEHEKQAVASMANAKANMGNALSRIATLESALRSAADSLDQCTKFVPESAYVYDTRTSLQERIKEWAEKARKPL